MSDTVIIGKNEVQASQNIQKDLRKTEQSLKPSIEGLQTNLIEASKLVDDIVLKKYLYKLTDLDIVPLDDSLKDISDIRIFKITEMVYQNNEYSTYKFASVFNAVQNLNCGVFVIVDSNGKKTDFYMGVRSLDDKRTTKSLKDTLRNAFNGQFPGVKTQDLLDSVAKEFLDKIGTKNIASVSCVAKNKDNEFKNNETFIQGLEKFTLAMQGQSYTAIILAKSTPTEQLEEIRKEYETIYTQLSPFANIQLAYGTNEALNISDALSHGTTTGQSYSKNYSEQNSTTHQEGISESNSESQQDRGTTIAKALGSAALGVLSIATAPLTGGASIAAATAITGAQIGLSAVIPKTYSTGISTSTSDSVSNSKTIGETFGKSTGESENETHTEGTTTGKSNNIQLTMKNKTLIDIMEKIELQLKRIDECESIGMWECATYILSDSQETTEMAAGTYKALMKGEKSGVETSAINFWGRQNKEKLPVLREYITNFIHPVFKYNSNKITVPVMASSLVSSNELAIQMGLPRKSVCGLPVIEHADFGKEVVHYDGNEKKGKEISLGEVFSMGRKTETKVNLDCDSLTMHTFITGSTGSGKSNAVYEMLNELKNFYNIPFLVIEPAKGEYKNVFGQFPDVTVYGTNPNISELLKINPFKFSKGIHILEHLDRLVEIFNVCWPMYAAMPAMLKEAMEKAYVAVGWDLSTSENEKGNKYPNFSDLLEQIEFIIDNSEYSVDTKGDYAGALLTRVRSLTNGLNGQIFCADDLKDEDLFDKNVIIDLSRVGSTETKSLIMGLLVMKLNEYRMDLGKSNSPLAHVTVLEEAHNLLKHTSTEQLSEGSNLLGKSVELISNSIAEMRTYGEGFIIADQSPGLLDMSVIRNTNTKIILRLPEKTDRELVGYAASLNEEQIDELAKLKKGVAAVYQNDWVEPVLVQINKCDISEKPYDFDLHKNIKKNSECYLQLIYLLIQGRIYENLKFDTDEIEKNIDNFKLSVRNINFIEEIITEYKETGKLELWNNSNFEKLATKVTDILGVRNRVENYVLSVHDYEELTKMLENIIIQIFPKVDEKIIYALSQCFMKDMSVQKDEREFRESIYKHWINFMKERSI